MPHCRVKSLRKGGQISNSVVDAVVAGVTGAGAYRAGAVPADTGAILKAAVTQKLCSGGNVKNGDIVDVNIGWNVN